MESVSWTNIQDLPRDILSQILSYLDVDDLFMCCHVSDKWRRLINDDNFVWRILCRLRWGITKLNGISFKEYYRITSSFDGYSQFAPFANMIIEEMNQLQAKLKTNKNGVNAPLTTSVLSPKRYTMMLTGKIADVPVPQPGTPLSFFDLSKLPEAAPRQRSNTHSPKSEKDKNCSLM